MKHVALGDMDVSRIGDTAYFFTASPLAIRDTVGSPLNPLAIL